MRKQGPKYPVTAVGGDHRRRIYTEEKATVVASIWGEEVINFLATLAVLPRTIMKNRFNSTRIILNI